MERVSVLCLLLLCSLTGPDLLNSEIIEQREPRPEQTQAGPPDVHAVLREMSAKLAVLQFRVDQLQTLNQEQAAKLTQFQSQQQAQANEVDTLRKQQQVQATELNSLKTWANVTENQVDSLRRDRTVGQVAFSASLLASGSEDIGPFNSHTPLVYKHVVSNIGNAYSPDTGLFTAPVRGAYHFEFYVGAHGHSSHGSAAVLVKNGQHVFAVYEHQTNGFGTSANGATLLLETGDVVFMRLWVNSRIFDNENRHSTFSGHLLFPM